jgi:hypothetical protein
MQITFNSYDSKVELEMTRDLVNTMLDRYDEMNPEMTCEEVDERADVTVTDEPAAESARLPDPPAAPAAESDDEAEADPAATAAPERDSSGRVWDERIDSSNRKTNSDGTWQKRRNVDDATRQAVIDELKLADSAPTETFAPPSVPAPPAAPAADAAAPPPPPAAEEADSSAPPTGATIEWGDVFQRTMSGVQNQTVTQEQMDAKVLEYGIEGGFPALIAHPEKWELFLTELML